MEDIYKKIRYLRVKNNMSQDELAEALGYTDRSSIAKIEGGKVDLKLSKIKAFANVFHVSIDCLLGLRSNSDHRCPIECGPNDFCSKGETRGVWTGNL